MSDNLVTIYMNYKTRRLLEYGLVIMDSTDSFLRDVLNNYIKTYINSSFYLIFDTVNSNTYDDKVMAEELEGKRLEMLDELANFELIDSNEEYERKIYYINTSCKIMPFLIKLDLLRFEDKDSISIKINELLDKDKYIKDMLGDRVIKLVMLLNETRIKLDKFFERKDNYYSLDYPLYKDRDNLVKVVLNNDVKAVLDNYNKSLVERVYRDKKIQKDKLDLLIKKFIKQLLLDIYNDKKLYDKYFIELDDSLFEDRKVLEEFFKMLDNPLIKHYLVFSIDSDNYYSNQAFIKKYNFSIACIQDFSHINDVSTKITNLDNNNLFDYIIVGAFKEKDYDTILKYSMINLKDILFSREG